jgi:putative tricarboxylic transport membrane protein
MALDRWIALIFVGICLVYGYIAWFNMDSGLAPFMQRNPIWPSTFPKLLSLLGLVTSMIVLFGLEKSEFQIGEIDYRRLHEYKLFKAIGLLALMAIYALTLRSLGFLISTASFLILGSYILGERKWTVMIPVGLIAAFSVWYLVSEVLEIYMRPLPHFLKLGN